MVAEVPRRLSVALNYLKRLCASLDGLDDLSCALCLLRSSPYLQHLEVKVSMDELDDEVEVSASFSVVTLNHLRTVEIEGITGTILDMQLIKLLLAKSPMLVRMLIEPDLYLGKQRKRS